MSSSYHVILVHISRVNSEEHGTMVETVGIQFSQLNWAEQYKKCVQHEFRLKLICEKKVINGPKKKILI